MTATPTSATPASTLSTSGAPTDLLGSGLAAHESAVLAIYDDLVATLRRDDLPPCVAANLRAALAPVAVAVTDLGLRFEHLTDLGV